MKKIINKNMQQQLAQALFGTIAVKIPLNKAGTFAAPIRATAKVVESLLKFANKRSFNLFVFASFLSLISISELWATCTKLDSYKYDCDGVIYKVEKTDSNGNMEIRNVSSGSKQTWIDSTGNPMTGEFDVPLYGAIYVIENGVRTKKIVRDATSVYTYDPNTGIMTSETRTNSGGSVEATTYDPNTGRKTSTAYTYSNGAGSVYTYDPDTGVMTSYTRTESYGTVYAETYDSNTGRRTSYTNTNSDGSSRAYTYDPNTRRQTSYTETNSDGSVYEVTYDPNTGEMTSKTCYDAEGNPIDGISKMNDRYIIAENGKVIARIDNSTYCNTSDGLSYCISSDAGSGKCVAIIKNSSGRVVGTQICKSSEQCWLYGSGKNASDCTTQFYSSDGKVIATYGEDGQPKNAYDYDGDGNKLVYDDQCAFVGKLDADGNSIYDLGDGLSSENRRTRYTPAEAAEIIGNSDDNMIVMYFK